jgi:hypothetical protein
MKMQQEEKCKMMTFRAPLSVWKFLKQLSLETETSVNEIMLRSIENIKKNHEKKLTDIDGLIE